MSLLPESAGGKGWTERASGLQVPPRVFVAEATPSMAQLSATQTRTMQIFQKGTRTRLHVRYGCAIAETSVSTMRCGSPDRTAADGATPCSTTTPQLTSGRPIPPASLTADTRAMWKWRRRTISSTRTRSV